jgi:hypothetical protein
MPQLFTVTFRGFAFCQMGFNAIRDNESRGARHQRRTSATITACHMSSTRERYPKFFQPALEASDVARLDSLTIKANVFSPLALDQSQLGFKAADVVDDRSNWRTTSTSALLFKQQALVLALLQRSEEDFECLWIASLFSENSVIRMSAPGGIAQYYLVLIVCPHLLVTWRLEKEGDTLVLPALPDQLTTVAWKSDRGTHYQTNSTVCKITHPPFLFLAVGLGVGRVVTVSRV